MMIQFVTKKKILLICLLILFCIQAKSQEIQRLNSYYALSDSLEYDSEIRIYKTFNYKRCSSVFRIYKDKSNDWHTSLLGCGQEKQFNKTNDEISLIFRKLLRNNTLKMPSLSAIKWKLNDGGKVVQTDEGYQLLYEKREFFHGVKFYVKVRLNEQVNSFNYNYLEEYLTYYPETDELIYMNEILKVIKEEFDIWKDE